MAEAPRDSDLEWLDHVQPVGLVVAPNLLKDLGLAPLQQTQADTAEVKVLFDEDTDRPALPDPWAFASRILGWPAQHVAGSAGGPALPDDLAVALPEHGTTLAPTWAVAELGDPERPWQLLVRIEAAGVDPDKRGAIDGWEATPHQRFERLLRDTAVFVGVLITDKALRLVYAPRAETSGYLSFPLRPLATVAGRPMLAGLKLLLDSFRLFADADDRRLPALLQKSREAQAAVSTALAEQVLGALHELLRGLDAAEPALIRGLAPTRSGHLYEGLLAVLMRLVFILYAEDRDLLPSLSTPRARTLYETGYAVRGLYAKLVEDAALHPDTMDERRGGWGRLLALFRLIYGGHGSGFVQARGGKLFDADEFPFLEGRTDRSDTPRVLTVSDGFLLRILEGLMTLKLRGAERERLSYRTLDVEQIGSVYETVMGFTVEAASARMLAIKAGKNNRTPIFLDLEALAAAKGTERIKAIKEAAGRQLSDAQAKPVKVAKGVEDLAAALDKIVDERGSPRAVLAAAGTPILQPTDERRRTGSHYTPRSLTGPIVRHALEPAFDRLGPDATPEQVLDLKVCDPAMGSGAFLVEACRALGERLVAAWARWPDKRPKIPADEDEELHARRLVAQRCLYGVDKNPRAVDLARLSLWLATLARDHEFTFLDHALKCGDSLVGLTTAQIAAANWDESKPGLTLFRMLIDDRVKEALKARAEIQNAPDDTMRAIQEARHRTLEGRMASVRSIGDAVVSAFFAADKAKAREKARADVESHISGMPPRWDLLEAAATRLRAGEHGITPFHWQVEFPEVFARENGGFDAIVGNPPFMGVTGLGEINNGVYAAFLRSVYRNTSGKTDISAFFFRRSFDLIRQNGALGLISTKTIAQGDTRESGLKQVITEGGSIYRVSKRYRWPGSADVVASTIHVLRGEPDLRFLRDSQVQYISSFLWSTRNESSPERLIFNSNLALLGAKIQANPFSLSSDEASQLEREIVAPVLGANEIFNSVKIQHNRCVFDLRFISPSQFEMKYPCCHYLFLSRLKLSINANLNPKHMQWSHGAKALFQQIANLSYVFVTSSSAATSFIIEKVPNEFIFSHKLVVFCLVGMSSFSALQCRAHEYWAADFSTSFGSSDALTYNPTQVFRTFPFPSNFETDLTLEAAGEAYHAFRAELMVARNESLTKTYNRFHARGENGADITRLRALHHEMDVAVLRAYGWDDLADRAAPEFIEQEADEGKTPKTRLDWPSDFKDEVLARLLALNATRAAEERAAGLIAAPEDDEGDLGEDATD